MKNQVQNFTRIGVLIFAGLFYFSLPVWAGTISGHVECKGVRTNQWAVVYIDTIADKEFSPPVKPVLSNQKAKSLCRMSFLSLKEQQWIF